MPSIRKAFLNFRDLINFCMSHGLNLSGDVVYSFEQSLDSSLHLLFMAFVKCYWALQVLSLLVPCPAELATISYCRI
jgi:hypothetical protein